MRNPVRAAAAAALIGGPTVLAFFSGGFFERPRLIAAVGAWALAGVAALVAPRPLPRGRAGIAMLAGLTLLTAWTTLSSIWAPLGERALEDTQRLVLYLGAMVAGVALLRGPAARRWVEPSVALGALVVTAYGLGDRLLPGLVTYKHSASAEGRLEQPLTYWNAMGCLAALAFVLGARLAADPGRPRGLRAAAGALTPVAAAGVYLSFSRGALLALAAGLVVLVALAPTRRRHLQVVGGLVGVGVLTALVSSFLPRVETLAAGQTGDQGQGAAMLAALVVAGALGGALAFRRGDERTGPPAPAWITRRPAVVAGVVVLVALGAIGGVAALEGTPSSRPDQSVGASRFRSAESLRYSYWDTALHAFARHPIAGTGTGGFAVEWRRRPDRPEPAVDAHSLYVETLSELGVVGLAFLALFLGGVIAAVLRLHRRDPALAGGLAAAMAVWLVHAGLDWDWEVPALTGVFLVLAAATVAWEDELAG